MASKRLLLYWLNLLLIKMMPNKTCCAWVALPFFKRLRCLANYFGSMTTSGQRDIKNFLTDKFKLLLFVFLLQMTLNAQIVRTIWKIIHILLARFHLRRVLCPVLSLPAFAHQFMKAIWIDEWDVGVLFATGKGLFPAGNFIFFGAWKLRRVRAW